jgi:hypothetical protein
MMADEVHTVNTAASVQAHLRQAVNGTPGAEAGFQERWLVNVDRDVLAGFMALGVL